MRPPVALLKMSSVRGGANARLQKVKTVTARRAFTQPLKNPLDNKTPATVSSSPLKTDFNFIFNAPRKNCFLKER
jgi:hypothetical protein